MQALSRENWVPLAVIVAADRNSSYYNEKDKAGSLYNEGWALAHMLQLSRPYSPLLHSAARCHPERNTVAEGD